MRKTIITHYDHRPSDFEVSVEINAAKVKGYVLGTHRYERAPGEWVVRVAYELTDEDLLHDTATEGEL